MKIAESNMESAKHRAMKLFEAHGISDLKYLQNWCCRESIEATVLNFDLY
jgi:hypothetical protein